MLWEMEMTAEEWKKKSQETENDGRKGKWEKMKISLSDLVIFVLISSGHFLNKHAHSFLIHVQPLENIYCISGAQLWDWATRRRDFRKGSTIDFMSITPAGWQSSSSQLWWAMGYCLQPWRNHLCPHLASLCLQRCLICVCSQEME